MTKFFCACVRVCTTTVLAEGSLCTFCTERGHTGSLIASLTVRPASWEGFEVLALNKPAVVLRCTRCGYRKVYRPYPVDLSKLMRRAQSHNAQYHPQEAVHYKVSPL